MTEGKVKFFLILQLWSSLNIFIRACQPPCLYFSTRKTISAIELSGNDTPTVVVPNAGQAIAVAVDAGDKLLYWSDQLTRTIQRIDLQSGKIENVITTELGYCEGISIEWVNKYIYWTDYTKYRIEMSRVNGSDRKVLFDTDLQKPRGITVDSVHGYMFWTDWGSNPKIERATLAGQQRTTIVAKSLHYPNDIIVDYTDNKIYWLDAGMDVVGKADLDGRNIKQSAVMSNSEHFAIALYNNIIYLTDWTTNSIKWMDKESFKDLGKFYHSSSMHAIMGITVLDPSRQPPVDSSCSHGNGGCSHFCFIVPDGYYCGCPNGTALREDGHTCQEANFTNCRNQPCLNGGTCFFNFAKIRDDCICSKYYVESDCGLYLGASTIRITLEMKVEEWDEETFKQAIVKGLRDYCNDDSCSYSPRNRTIAKQFCHSFLNVSTFNASQVKIIEEPTKSLDSNHVNVYFAVLLRSSPKPMVVVNTTLEYIVQESANSINKRLGSYKIVYVNNLHPSSDISCNTVGKNDDQDSANESGAQIIGATVGGIASLVVVVVSIWYIHSRRKRKIGGNQDNNDEVIENEFVEDIADRRESHQSEDMSAPGRSRSDILLDKDNFNHERALSIQSMPQENQDIVGNQQRENCEVCESEFAQETSQQSAGANENINSPQALFIPQGTFNSAMEIRNIVGNQQRDNSEGRDCEMIPKETLNRTLTVPPGSTTPHNANQADVSSDHENRMHIPSDGLDSEREAVEHDENDDGLGTCANPIQCTDDVHHGKEPA